MKLFQIIGGLFIIIFMCLIPLTRKLEEYDVQKNGETVTATITYIPVCFGTKTTHFMKFNFGGKKYDKSVGCGFNDTHKVGDTIKLKHKEGTEIFLFETENIEGEFISSGLLALVGIVFIFMGTRRK